MAPTIIRPTTTPRSSAGRVGTRPMPSSRRRRKRRSHPRRGWYVVVDGGPAIVRGRTRSCPNSLATFRVAGAYGGRGWTPPPPPPTLDDGGHWTVTADDIQSTPVKCCIIEGMARYAAEGAASWAILGRNDAARWTMPRHRTICSPPSTPSGRCTRRNLEGEA